MILDWLEQTLFSSKLVDDVRTIESNAIFSLEVPSALWNRGEASAETTTTICALLPPDFRFYHQLVVLVLCQSLFNAILGFFVYHIIVVVQPQNNRHESESKAKAKTNAGWPSTSTTALLFAYGIAIPCVVLEPIYAIQALDIQNRGLIMTFLATPIVNSLRITEALYGFAPETSRSSVWNYVFYFSCLFGMEFDASKNTPRKVNKEFFGRRLRTLGRDFVIVSLLISILEPFDYEFFDTHSPVDSMTHSLSEMVSWKHILNNLLVAILVSTSLSQSSLGVSLIYNIFYGAQTYEVVLNPMLKSKSPSDFWGRRWNVLVHNGLKNGVYKPTRKHTSSRMWAVVATFVVSGIIHEYVNYVMFQGKGDGDSNNNDSASLYQFKWKQMMFFGWNGILILLEYTIGHWEIFRWASRSLPPIAITFLVLVCALPLAHLFTGDWIKHGYFDAVYLAEPIVVCQQQGV